MRSAFCSGCVAILRQDKAAATRLLLLSFELFYSLVKFVDIVQERQVPLVLSHWPGWNTDQNFARRHALCDRTHGRGDCAITNFNMAVDANLSGKGHIISDPHAPRNSDLRANDSVPTDGNVVGNLHQIIDLHTLLNPSPSETGAIHG